VRSELEQAAAGGEPPRRRRSWLRWGVAAVVAGVAAVLLALVTAGIGIQVGLVPLALVAVLVLAVLVRASR
jgi:hypothetical protein